MFSTLGVSAEDRLSSSSPIGLPLVRWSSQDFTELVSQSLKAFDREKKEMQLILVPQVRMNMALLHGCWRHEACCSMPFCWKLHHVQQAQLRKQIDCMVLRL